MRKAGLLIVAMLGLTGCATTLLNAVIPDNGYRLSRDVVYGDHPRHRLDVYVPVAAKAPAPVVLFLHGGRWQDGSKDLYPFLGEAFTSRGYVVVIPNYRLYPEVKFPLFVEDAAQAVHWVRSHAREYGGDPDRIFLMGHSSGAHMAAMLALNPEYLRKVGERPQQLAGMIGLAGPYDFLPLTEDDTRDMFGPPERYALSQPINYVDGRNPPMLLLHGRNDQTVKLHNIENLAAKIKEKGGKVETRIYPSMAHVRIMASMAKPLRFGSSILDDIAGFIDRQSTRKQEP